MGIILDLKSVNMTYLGGYTGLIDINFELHEGEKLVFVGGEDSGKTNLARAIAGLERISSGSITYMGRDMKTIPLKDRNIALFFDESSLFDKKTLFGNLAYPMELRNYKEEDIVKRINELAKLFNIEKYLQYSTKELPEKVRKLALFIRLFVIDRSLYIFDSPFTDFTKEEKKALINIAKPLLENKNVLYLTNDLEEGLEFNDKAYIMYDCKIVDNANYYTVPNHIATAMAQGGKEVFAALRKIDNAYYLDIMEEDIIDLDRERFVENENKEMHLIKCAPPISDIYIDKNILCIRNMDKQIDIYNYYDLLSKYNIAKISR